MQKRFYLTPLAVILFILFFTVFGDRGLLRINHLHRDQDEMQKQLEALKGENDRLKREISALQSDRRYLESIARRDFGLVRGNEVIYQFPQDKTGVPADKDKDKDKDKNKDKDKDKDKDKKGAQPEPANPGAPGAALKKAAEPEPAKPGAAPKKAAEPKH